MKTSLFRTGQLVGLRLLERSDAPAIQRWMNDPTMAEQLAHPLPLSAKAAYDMTIMFMAGRKHLAFGLVDLKAQSLIGINAIYDINWPRRTGMTGTILGERKYWEKGYGSEAKMLLLDYAFASMDLFAVLSRTPSSNDAAIGHLQKCGYVEVGRIPNWLRCRTGERCDEILYMLTQEKWRQSQKPNQARAPKK